MCACVCIVCIDIYACISVYVLYMCVCMYGACVDTCAHTCVCVYMWTHMYNRISACWNYLKAFHQRIGYICFCVYTSMNRCHFQTLHVL